jgi:ribosomal protein S18 acetylase RimI-like enzyme
MHVRPFDPAVDEAALFKLWDCTFGSGDGGNNWPVTQAWFRAVALFPSQHQDHFLAEFFGQAIGFVLVQVNASSPSQGSILALGVHPDYRRRGVGRMLLQAALERLQLRGVQRVKLGSGGQTYFWPGVPVDLPDAWPFFHAMGWHESERSFDLARSLDDYETPAWVMERISGLGVDFVNAGEAKLDREIIDFVSREQPGWVNAYTRAVRNQHAGDILCAVQPQSGDLLGACLVESPDLRWVSLFHQPLGAPGCIFTAESAQGRGIGMALTARATEILQMRGCHTSFLGWTWLVEWYGRLGYKVWQEYVMSCMELGANCLG